MITPSCKRKLILFAFLCLSFNLSAQNNFYTRLLKGERSPYDTAVSIHIPEYRRIRLKVTLADSLIEMLNIELVKSYKLYESLQAANSTLTFANTEQAKTISRQAATIHTVNEQFNELFDRVSRPKPFFEKPVVLICTGFTVGVVGTIAIINAARK